MDAKEFFSEYGEASRYRLLEVIGRGSYGIVCSAIDTQTGEKVAIKKINDIFEHVSDATRILREVKLLRLLRHPDIVEIKHMMLPPSRRSFKDIYVVFELMESDLHQVIKANDDLTPEHYQFFLYQLLRALKYIHTANVFHRDLKPKNILANADCKLKICDFGLARVAFSDAPTAIFWTDYVATRWYRAPELCGSFFSKYTPAIDIWSIGCIFAELLTGKPLFPGKNVVHQLELMTDLLGTPLPESIAKVRNEKARRYLSSMRRKPPVPLQQRFANADPAAVKLLTRLLAFDPAHRPSAEEALADPYFKGLAKVEREPSAQPITKVEFEFERRRLNMDDVRELIYRETFNEELVPSAQPITEVDFKFERRRLNMDDLRELIYREALEYHPNTLREYLMGSESGNYLFPSAADQFRRQFQQLEEHYSKGNAPGTQPPQVQRHAMSLPKERVSKDTPLQPREQERGDWEQEEARRRPVPAVPAHPAHASAAGPYASGISSSSSRRTPQAGGGAMGAGYSQQHRPGGGGGASLQHHSAGHSSAGSSSRPAYSNALAGGFAHGPSGARPGRVVGGSGSSGAHARPGPYGHLTDEQRRYARTAALSAQSPFHNASLKEGADGDRPGPPVAAAEAR